MFKYTVIKTTIFFSQCEEHFKILRTYFQNKEPFVHWKSSMDVTGSSWNHQC